jgi:hypothetical protein
MWDDYPLEKLTGKVGAAPHPTGHSPGHLLPRGEKGRRSRAAEEPPPTNLTAV